MKMIHKRSRYQAGSLTTENRGSGTKVFIFRWREPTINGKTKQRKVVLGTVKELTKTQAQKKANELLKQMEPATQLETSGKLTVNELFAHYEARELGDDSGRAAKPRKAYLYIIRNYLKPKWGECTLSAVKAVAVEDWLKTLPLANGSKAKIREVFGAAFRHAIRHELYAINPIASVRQVRRRSTEPEILEPVEIAAILLQLEGIEPVRTAFLVAAVLGMRRGEIFGLKWADVDQERAVLHVRRSYVDGVEGHPKTESSRRPLPVPPQLLDAFNSWKEIAKYKEADDWVFASDLSFGKQPLWPGTLWRRNVAPAIERAKITKPKLGWHTLRRSYASLLLFTGASLRVSMELMRHSTPDMTLGTYAQAVGDEKRNAGEKVALLVLKGGKAA